MTVPVSGFKPEELSVKVAGNSITIEAKHEEKDENTGNVRSFQQMRRSFFLPTPFDGDALVSSLSTEGVLTVTAPRKVQQPSASQKSIEIPITRPSIDSNPTQWVEMIWFYPEFVSVRNQWCYRWNKIFLIRSKTSSFNR